MHNPESTFHTQTTTLGTLVAKDSASATLKSSSQDFNDSHSTTIRLAHKMHRRADKTEASEQARETRFRLYHFPAGEIVRLLGLLKSRENQETLKNAPQELQETTMRASQRRGTYLLTTIAYLFTILHPLLS